MSLDWERLLAQNGIEFVTSGPNTKRGELSVRCPFCGQDDPSQHLGISLSKDVWGCHRNSAHRGKSPVRLVAALLGCSMSTAQLTLKQYTQNDPDDLEQALVMLIEEEKPVEEESYMVSFPPEFKLLTSVDRFGRYLARRLAFSAEELDAVLTRFNNLRCATTGRYKDRIIFPLYLNGDLIGWTARAITDPVKAPRYLASSKRAKMTLYGLEQAQNGGELLFIVEGPMDALAINTLPFNSEVVSAVALMGTSVTVPQLGLLRGLQKKFKQIRIMLDSDAFEPSVRLQEALKPGRVPCGALTNSWYKDPASMGRNHLRILIEDALIPF